MYVTCAYSELRRKRAAEPVAEPAAEPTSEPAAELVDSEEICTLEFLILS